MHICSSIKTTNVDILCSRSSINLITITHLCHVEPHTDRLALLKSDVELPTMKEIIKATPQALEHSFWELNLFIIPACKSICAPIQQDLQQYKVKQWITNEYNFN